MNKRIIYQTDEGGLAIIVPSEETINVYGVEAIALKDVPAGKPFKIIDTSQIPSDRIFRNAWQINESSLTDGVGAESNEFPKD